MTVYSAQSMINVTVGFVEDLTGIAVQREMSAMTACVTRRPIPVRHSPNRPALPVMTDCTVMEPMSVLVEAAFMEMIPV